MDQTTEHLTASEAPHPLARFGVRALAKLTDVVILNVASALLLCLYAVLQTFGLSAAGLIPWLISLFVLFSLGYFSLGTSDGRQTLGYRLGGIRVVLVQNHQSDAGLGCCLGRAIIDLFFLALTQYLIGLLDYLPIAVTPAKRALHDLATGTAVIATDRPRYVALGVWASGIVIVPLVAVFLVIRPLFMQAFYMPSPSMTPTISPNEHFIVNKFYYLRNRPHRGDIIVFNVPAEVASYQKSRKAPEFIQGDIRLHVFPKT